MISLSLILLIQPAYFQYTSLINTIYTYCRPIYAFLLILMFLSYGRRKVCKPFIILLIMELWILLISLLNVGSINSLLYELSSVIGLATMFELGASINITKIINVTYWVLYAYIAINLITLILYPQGMYSTMGGDGITVYWQNWFLGYKNYPIRLFIPVLAIAHIRCYIYDKMFLSTVFLYIICWYSAIRLDSSTSLVGMLVFTLGIFCLYNFKYIRKIINIYTIMAMIIISFLMIVVMQEQNELSVFITNYFGKDLTFTGRTTIWAGTMKAFLNNPLWGYGQFTAAQFQQISGTFAFHPHNYFFYLLIRGGIIELTLALLIFFEMVRSLSKYKNIVISKYSLIFLACMLIMGLTESIITTAILFYPTIILFSHIEEYEIARKRLALQKRPTKRFIKFPKIVIKTGRKVV